MEEHFNIEELEIIATALRHAKSCSYCVFERPSRTTIEQSTLPRVEAALKRAYEADDGTRIDPYDYNLF